MCGIIVLSGFGRVVLSSQAMISGSRNTPYLKLCCATSMMARLLPQLFVAAMHGASSKAWCNATACNECPSSSVLITPTNTRVGCHFFNSACVSSMLSSFLKLTLTRYLCLPPIASVHTPLLLSNAAFQCSHMSIGSYPSKHGQSVFTCDVNAVCSRATPYLARVPCTIAFENAWPQQVPN